MGKRSLAILLGTVSAMSLGYVMPIAAQTTDQPAAAGTTGLEEVIVTARRREERAQTVPITLTTVSQAQMETQQIHNANDLARDIPGFSLCCGTGGNVTFTWIRGVTGVIGYFDQAPIDLYGPALYFDQDSVQVLKGPQGTLFGLATNGGAILYESKKPSSNFEGFVQGEGGNYGHYQFQGAVNVPIVPDKLLVRVGGEITETDGFIHDIGDNKDLANEDYYIGRVSVTARPTDDIENTTVVNYVWDSSNYAGDDFIPYEVNPGKVFAEIPVGPLGNVPLTLGNGPALTALENPATQIQTFLQLLKMKNPSLSFFPNIAQLYAEQRKIGFYSVVGTSIPGGPYERDQRWNIVNTSNWDLNDDFTVKNVASYQEILDQIRGSTSLLPIPLLDQAQATVPAAGPEVQYTDDLQFLGKLFNDNLTFTLGAFGLMSSPQTAFPGGAYFPGRGPHPIQYNCTLGTCTGETQISHRHTEALYGQGTYNLSELLEGLSFTAGYRYTWDHAYINDNNYTGASFNGTGLNYTGTGALTSSVSAEAAFHAPSQLYELQYQFAPTSMVYVSYNKGFSTGGFNPGQPAPPISRVYQPEVLKEVEAGIKSDFDLGIVNLESVKARTNFAAYYGDYLNIKQNVTALSQSGALAVYTFNVASAYTEGVEGQFTIQPIEDLTLGLNFSWNHVAFTNFFLPATTPGGAPTNYDAAPQSYNPYWQYNLTETYRLPINPEYGVVSLSANYSWTGKHSNTIILPQIPENVDPEFSDLDMNLAWKDPMGYDGITARLWVTNLLQEQWGFGSLAAYQALGIYDRSVAKPQEYGFTLRYDFGGEGETGPAPAPYTPPPAQAPAAAPVARSYMVFFDFNKSDLTPEAVAIVDQAAKNAGPAKATELTVTGHTDTVGSDAYNMRLSKRRAESVAAELEKDGIPAAEIAIVAKGKRDLLVPTKDGVREPQNRRVTIVYDGGATS
jgi:iron complex outermembrane receptor protein